MNAPRTGRERQIQLESGQETLFGVVYSPATSSQYGVVLCHPLFEERKSAHRPLVTAARTLARTGCTVLHVDYRGCGDSTGDFAGFSVPDWLDDIAVAATFLREHRGCEHVALLGLRAGAAFALLAAGVVNPEALLLWEPVTNGADYIHAELRKKLMKEMVTFGRTRTTRSELIRQLGDGSPIDFDGYKISPALYADLCRIDLLAPPPTPCPTLVVSIAGREEGSPQTRRLVECLGEHAVLHPHRAPPFWNLIGLTDCSALITTTCEWLEDLWAQEGA